MLNLKPDQIEQYQKTQQVEIIDDPLPEHSSAGKRASEVARRYQAEFGIIPEPKYATDSLTET